MLTRLWYLAGAVFMTAIVLGAGWLQTARDRSVAILVLALCAVMLALAFRPRRR